MQFSLLGFPTRVTGSFLLTIGFIGFISFPEQIDRIILFAAVATVAVLIHELGHAFAAKSQGTTAPPQISLEGFAGLTRYRLQTPPGRLQSIFISFAGPLAGIVLGLIVVGLDQAGVFGGSLLARDFVRVSIFTTFIWSAFNLLPIVPLDGGHIMTDLLPGEVHERQRLAAMVSIFIAVVVGAVLWWQLRLLFAPIILGLMAWQNYQTLAKSKRPAVPR